MSFDLSVENESDVILVDLGNVEEYNLVDTRALSGGEERVLSDGEVRLVATDTAADKFVYVDLENDVILVE